MLNLHREGEGEPLLLLHGIGMRWQWWAPCLEPLAARYDVIAVDFPGFGASPALAGAPTPAALTDAIEELARLLELERPHVAGISLGGLVALELARRGLVRSATAFSPAGFATGWQRAWLDGSLRATRRLAGVLAPRAGRLFSSPAARKAASAQLVARAERIPAAELAAHFRATAASDFDRTRGPLVAYDFPAGPPPGVPVTIAWGSRDALLLPRQARRALTRIPGAHHAPLPGASHIPTYDDPDAVVRVIRETAA